MAAVPSTMMPLGTHAPEFSLPNVTTGKLQSLSELASKKATLVMFICNHCKYVKHIQQQLTSICNEYTRQGLSIIAISSNDAVNFPEDAPEQLREQANRLGFTFPYLYDESQEVAKAYDAACTPDFFLFDGNLSLIYRGQFDDARPSLLEVPVTGRDLKNALEAALKETTIDANQRPSIGCNIKWKA